jgi:hypothetical protein
VTLPDIAGRALVPGSITITEDENAMLADVLGSPVTAPGTLHPMFAYIAPQRGIGTSVKGLCDLAEFDIDDGPMMGSIDIQIPGDLKPGVEYRIEGEIVSIVRKHGRNFDFDLMTFVERMVDPAGELVSSTTNTFVLPRKDRE